MNKWKIISKNSFFIQSYLLIIKAKIMPVLVKRKRKGSNIQMVNTLHGLTD